jgi:methyl-accepting chemotaxis protein
MAAAPCFALFAFQATYDPGAHRDVHFIMIALVTMASLMVFLMIGLLITGIYGLKMLKTMERIIDETREKVEPAFAKGVEFFDDISPKVRSITSNVEQICYTAREKADEVGETISQVNKTVADINGKTRLQISRVDGMVTEALHTTQQISRTVQEGIRGPVKQIAGLVAGVKAAAEKLVQRSPFNPQARKPQPPTSPYDL